MHDSAPGTSDNLGPFAGKKLSHIRHGIAAFKPRSSTSFHARIA
jgi:hypothetical protein